MRKILKSHNWNNIYRYDNAQTAYTNFNAFIVENFENCFPKQTFKITYKNRCEWIDQNLKNDIFRRETLYVKKQKYPTEENVKEYKLFRNIVISKQRKAEREFYRTQFDLYKTDLRKSWKIIKTIIGKSDRISNISDEFLINEKIVSDKTFITNAFNNYFLNVGKTLSKNIVSTGDPLSYVNSNLTTIFVPSIQEIEILNVMSLLNNSTAGYDDLQPSIMKMLTKVYIKPLTYLINISIKQGIFPEELKMANVIPIYKSDDKQLIQNYRPISVISYFSKVFEFFLYNHVIDFLEHNNILYDFQFGFRKHHSTNHAIITMVEKVSNALDTGKIVVGVFLDLKKSFDTVNHDILL